jgi:RNA polymerase sigma-70 factor (ECF subfamily)
LLTALSDVFPALSPGDATAAAVRIEKALARARERWPGTQLDDAAFLRHLARHAPSGLEGLAALHLEDLFLACGCLAGDRAALAGLESGLLAQVPQWVATFDGVDAEEVKQEVRQKLLLGDPAHLAGFAGRGALQGWVRIVALRCAIGRQRQRKPGDGERLEELLSEPDPELDFIKLHDRKALQALLHDAFRELPVREKNLLKLHYVEGVSLPKLAALEGVSRATVVRSLRDARQAALERVRSLLRDRLRLSQKEGESLLRFLRSRLDLSLRRALSRTPPPGR